MKRILLFFLCTIMVFSFAACGEKPVINDNGNSVNNGDFSDSTFEGNNSQGEDDESLLNIQDIIGFWNPISIYQSPRATDGRFESDEAALEYAQGLPIQISANEFFSPLFYTDSAVYKKIPIDLDSLSSFGIQVDETLEALVGEGEIIRLDIYNADSDAASFNVFIINSATMLYEGDGGYIFMALLEESVG